MSIAKLTNTQLTVAIRAGEAGTEVHGGTTAPSYTEPALRRRRTRDRRCEGRP